MNRKKYEDIHCMGTKNLPILIHDMVCLFRHFFNEFLNKNKMVDILVTSIRQQKLKECNLHGPKFILILELEKMEVL